MNTNELWQAVLGELELSLSKAHFTTWFRNTFVVSFDGGQVCIGVPNMFTKAWLEKKYHKEIYQCLQTHTNNSVKVICYKVEASSAMTAQPIMDRNEPVSASQSEEPGHASAPAPSYRTEPERTNQTLGEFSINAKYTFGNFIVGKQNELA